MKDTESAFRWIINILNKNKIDYQISGGFAVRLYGSSRELADIDIDIDEKYFPKILPEIKGYIIFGPGQYVDENWNLELITLKYKGQVIDISGRAKIYDKNKNEWVNLGVDFSNNNYMTVYGMSVPVITKELLVSYKSKLLREVDKKDIEELGKKKEK